MCAAPDGVSTYLPTTHQWPGKGDGECFHFKSPECVLWINELSFNNWRILSTNGYNLCPSPVGFVNLSFISLYDEHLWRSDERFCLWRLLCSLTKGYAEWPIGVQSLLLICQPVMNTADGLYCNDWRLPNVLFNWLSTIGHPVTQKGVFVYLIKRPLIISSILRTLRQSAKCLNSHFISCFILQTTCLRSSVTPTLTGPGGRRPVVVATWLGPILPTCHHVRTSPFRRCDVPMSP